METFSKHHPLSLFGFDRKHHKYLYKDTFLLSRDVESYLRAHKIIDGGLQTKKSLTAAQAFFNEMQKQSGLSLQELSLIVAYSVGDNRVGISQQTED